MWLWLRTTFTLNITFSWKESNLSKIDSSQNVLNFWRKMQFQEILKFSIEDSLQLWPLTNATSFRCLWHFLPKLFWQNYWSSSRGNNFFDRKIYFHLRKFPTFTFAPKKLRSNHLQCDAVFLYLGTFVENGFTYIKLSKMLLFKNSEYANTREDPRAQPWKVKKSVTILL